jgi:hypothetical protein
MQKLCLFLVTLCLILGIRNAEAATCGTLPFTFSPNTTISSSQVNANFNALLNCANVLLAPLVSPTFTGTPMAPTATPSTSNNQIATTAFVAAALNKVPSTVTTTHPVVPSDCGVPIYAQGAAFYAITLPAVAGFAPGCLISIVDNDTRGKTITVAGLSSGGFGYTGCGISNICPGQLVSYRATAAAWVMEQNPGTWRPTTAVTLFVSLTGANTNDGIDPAGPLTLAFACAARSFIDLGATGLGNNVTIQIADGTYSGGAGATMCSITGNLGSSSPSLTFINGNNSTPGNVILDAGAGGIVLFTKDGGETGLSNFAVFGSGSAIGLFGAQYSIIDVNSGMILGCQGTSGNGFQVGEYASININSTVTMGGSPTSCTQGILGYLYVGGKLTGTGNFTFPNGAAVFNYTTAVFFNQGGFFDMRALSFTVTATVTGTRFANYDQAVAGTAFAGALYTNALVPSAFIPGNVDVAFPLEFAGDFGKSTAFSKVPGCAAGMTGQQYYINDSTTQVWGASVSGGGGLGAIITCSPSGGGAYTVIGK